jgi:erythronate-4-phosphate dehydrogenase
MKITIDENIANAEEVFSGLGITGLLPGREITNETLKNSDALIVRSITNVNEELLRGTKVKFVGTATIGSDHIDTGYLVKNNIAFADAKGCNAEAVKEYVFAALTEAANKKNLKFKDLSLGIIGAGNIGSRVVKCAEVLGIRTILNDPPLQRKTGDKIYKDLDTALQADVITLHVPLNKEGTDKTFHLFDYERLNRLKENSVLINSSRGSVIHNEALEKIINKKNLTVILDVWENEPEINSSLLEKVFIGTPHIAGYSYEGKINGTMMIYSALCRFLNKEEDYFVKMPQVENPLIELNNFESIEAGLKGIFRKIYDIRKDDSSMRKIITDLQDDRKKYFDRLRRDYPLRREFINYTIKVPEEHKELKNILQVFRFKVV